MGGLGIVPVLLGGAVGLCLGVRFAQTASTFWDSRLPARPSVQLMGTGQQMPCGRYPLARGCSPAACSQPPVLMRTASRRPQQLWCQHCPTLSCDLPDRVPHRPQGSGPSLPPGGAFGLSESALPTWSPQQRGLVPHGLALPSSSGDMALPPYCRHAPQGATLLPSPLDTGAAAGGRGWSSSAGAWSKRDLEARLTARGPKGGVWAQQLSLPLS